MKYKPKPGQSYEATLGDYADQFFQNLFARQRLGEGLTSKEKNFLKKIVNDIKRS